jgi:glutamate dehydrogenase
MPKDLAAQIARLPLLGAAFDIVSIAMDQKLDAEDTARAYFSLGSAFDLDWLRQQARFIPADNHWQADAIAKLVDNLYAAQAALAVRVLKASGKHANPVTHWMNAHAEKTGPVLHILGELKQAGTLDIPMLVIAEQRLRDLYSA